MIKAKTIIIKLPEKDEWTSGSITKGRKRGLKILAKQYHRSYGQHLEHLLNKAGVPSLTEKQYETEIDKFRGETK